MFTSHPPPIIGRPLTHQRAVTRRELVQEAMFAGAAVAAGMPRLSLAAQPAVPEATPDSSDIERIQLFEVTVPPTSMPERPDQICASYWLIQRHLDVSVEITIEPIRSRALWLDKGSLDVWPAADALCWKADVANGGEPALAVAGEVTRLEVGDVLYLPAIRVDEINPDLAVRLVNAGDNEALLFAFHLHEAGGQIPRWPYGIVDVGPESDLSVPEEMAGIWNDPVVFRLSRTNSPPGTVIPVPPEAAFIGYFMLSGMLEDSGSSASESTWRNRWPVSAGRGAWVVAHPNATRVVTVASGEPAVFMELAVIPGGATDEAANPAT